MKKIILFSFILLNIQIVLSQQNTQQTDSITNMEKSPFLGLRTTIYKVGDIVQAKALHQTQVVNY